MDMRDHIRERSKLAHTYAEDGAYHSAARILTQLAVDIAEHARLVDLDMDLPSRPTKTVTIELAA